MNMKLSCLKYDYNAIWNTLRSPLVNCELYIIWSFYIRRGTLVGDLLDTPDSKVNHIKIQMAAMWIWEYTIIFRCEMVHYT